MSTLQEILYRLRKGQSERAIARDLGLARMTIRRYHDLAETEGYLDPDTILPDDATIETLLRPLSPPSLPLSTVEPYRPLVEAWHTEGIEGVAILRRLREHHGYTGSYSSIRRFLLRLAPPDRPAIARIETPPGVQSQVDFGTLGRLFDAGVRRERTAYAFVMTLAYSRHQYLELVFDQTIPTWIGCHRRAFESFGGVVREVVIDNLKAAILKAALDDPEASRAYTRMARHYGFLIHPCRPRTPEHKGKVESGIHYVERNFWDGDDFVDLDDANRKARVWVREVAGVRDHGTTHEAPLLRFERDERAALLPLPDEPYDLLDVRGAKVHRDGYVVAEGSYYLAPPGHMGQTLDVFVFERVVQLFEGTTLLVTYERAKRKGDRLQREEYLSEGARLYLERTPEYCRTQAERIGPSCLAVVESMLAQRPMDPRPAVARLIGLETGYGDRRLEAACARALAYGDPHHRRVKAILRAGLDTEPLEGNEVPSLGRAANESDRSPLAIPAYVHARPIQAFFPAELFAEERYPATEEARS
jgi:transposase